MAQEKTKNKKIDELATEITNEIAAIIGNLPEKTIVLFGDYQKMIDDDYDKYLQIPVFNSDHTYPESVKKIKRVYIHEHGVYVDGIDEDRIQEKRIVQMNIDRLTLKENADLCDYLNTLAI